jgi:hypothetical protein
LDNHLFVESCKVDEFSNDLSLRSAHDYFPRNGGIYKSRSDYFIETASLTAVDALSYLAAVIALTVACALISRVFIADSLISKLLFYVAAFVLALEVTILSIARAKHRLAPSAARAASLYGPARAGT